MDIIFSIGLIIFSLYCYYLVGAESPAPTPTELGAAFWPRIILVLMIILLSINVYKQLKERKGKETEKIDVVGFFKSKLFIGMIIVAVMAIILPMVGFVTTSILFLVAYGALLGENRYGKLVLYSFLITLILYIVFQGLLDIRLERGYGIFRSLALTLEGLILNIKRGF